MSETKAPARTASAPPAEGSATSVEHVPSAEGETSQKSLAGLAKMDPAQFDRTASTTAPADQTEIVTIEGHEAAKSPPSEIGTNDIGGGNIAKVLDPPPDTSKLSVPLAKERAAMLSKVGQKLSGFVHRPPNEWGLLGPGETVRGHAYLLDLNSGEKVEANDGHKIGEGQLYANLRCFPESLSTGDTIEQILG